MLGPGAIRRMPWLVSPGTAGPFKRGTGMIRPMPKWVLAKRRPGPSIPLEMPRKSPDMKMVQKWSTRLWPHKTD